MARGSTVRGPGGRGGSSFLPGPGSGRGYENLGAKTVTCGFPVTVRTGVPDTTARGWVRRFRARAPELGVAFAALAVELGGEAIRPPAQAGRFGLTAIAAAFEAATALPGWLALGRWRFASAVSGGRLIAANTTSPWLIVGRRRFMPPVPPLPA